MYILHSKWFSSYSQISQILWFVIFFLSASISCKSRRKQSVLRPTSWSTALILNSFVLLVMCKAFVVIYYEFLKSWVCCTKSQSMRLMAFVCKQICNITHMCYYNCICDYWMFRWKQDYQLIWSAALVSLVHRSLVRALQPSGSKSTRGKRTISHQVVYHTWCRVLGSTSPTHKLSPCLAHPWIDTRPIRCRNFVHPQLVEGKFRQECLVIEVNLFTIKGVTEFFLNKVNLLTVSREVLKIC